MTRSHNATLVSLWTCSWLGLFACGQGVVTGGGDPFDASSAAALKVGKVTICHIPPGNPGNAHTITVGAPAVPAHLAHGDYEGPCVACVDSDQDGATAGSAPSCGNDCLDSWTQYCALYATLTICNDGKTCATEAECVERGSQNCALVYATCPPAPADERVGFRPRDIAPGVEGDSPDGSLCDDGIDNDCDGTDAECAQEPTCADLPQDLDGDGYACDDCNDSDATVHPGAAETCGDGIDQDCNGSDLDCPPACPDEDGDGHTDAACGGTDCVDNLFELCATYGPIVSGGTGLCDPCDSSCWDSALINPGMTGDDPFGTLCENGIDDDCDGVDATCVVD